MMVFRAKSLSISAIQWNGTNDATIVTNFGDYIAAAGPGEDPDTRLITTVHGTQFTVHVGDWVYLDVIQHLKIALQEEMYKTYDYVSG